MALEQPPGVSHSQGCTKHVVFFRHAQLSVVLDYVNVQAPMKSEGFKELCKQPNILTHKRERLAQPSSRKVNYQQPNSTGV